MGNTLKLSAVTAITIGIQWIYPNTVVATTVTTAQLNAADSLASQMALAMVSQTSVIHGAVSEAKPGAALKDSSPYVPPVEDGPERSQGSGTR
ncbi:hypothetical protein IQ268_21990 [Oculatella sp. LEGE 06141]|uniref:hypothetical protein n=1 Tax=Oculatella sp. LEGE 06141 TaxID=1828648 RepID=UPI00187EDE0F|nr:hypothetical protein [Oculatella sp. LEGE 06141]MBE9181236.1 hypothetical protein [Oculatella sp. LEGE 06141]